LLIFAPCSRSGIIRAKRYQSVEKVPGRELPSGRDRAPHRLDHLIDQLFTREEDRALARSWAVRLDKDGVGDRTEALIREAALASKRADGTEMTPAQAREYMADFARTIGVLDPAINSSIGWLDSGTKDDPAAAPTDHAEIERRIARQDADKYERMMREEPGKYWSSPVAQEKYRDALERSLAPPLVPAEQGGEGSPTLADTEPPTTPTVGAADAKPPA
jgi:hypothetical protein